MNLFPPPSLYLNRSPINSPDTILAIIFTTVYSTDMLLNFFVAYYAEGELVTDLRKIAGARVFVCVWGGGAAVGTSAECWRTRMEFRGGGV